MFYTLTEQINPMGWINLFKHGINYLKDSFNPMGLIHIKEERSRVRSGILDTRVRIHGFDFMLMR